MIDFYLAICADKFYIYDKKNGSQQSFAGNPFFEYTPSKISTATDELLQALIENNNLSDRQDLRFSIIESADPVKNDVVAAKLGEQAVVRFPLGNIVDRMMIDLGKNPKNHIELGINYDGICYTPKKSGAARQSSFSLLANTVEPDMLLKYVD